MWSQPTPSHLAADAAHSDSAVRLDKIGDRFFNFVVCVAGDRDHLRGRHLISPAALVGVAYLDVPPV